MKSQIQKNKLQPFRSATTPDANQERPVELVTAAEGRRTFCLLLGDEIAHFRRSPQEWKCQGITRNTRHVHVSDSTKVKLIEKNRATVLDEARGIIALAAAESSAEGEAA